MNDEEIAGDRISAAQLAEIEKRANDATEGPWFIEGNTVMNATRSYTVVLFGESAEDDFDSNFIACSRSDIPALIAEIRAAWGEAEAATRALREILDIESIEEQHHTLHFDSDAMGRGICSACGFLWPCVFERARALVGSENRKADDMGEKRHARSEAGFIEPIKVADSVPSEIPQAAIAPQAASSTFKMDDPYGSERGLADQLAAALADCAGLNCARALYNQPTCGTCTTCRARSALAEYKARGSSVRTQESASEAK